MAKNPPIEHLGGSYSALLAVCDRLEAVADALPGCTPDDCTRLAVEVVELLALTHAQEENLLLPLLAGSPRPELVQLGRRLREEHAHDEAAALEVQEALLALADRQPLRSVDATGYLLRSFFESLRRHVRSEQDLLGLLPRLAPDMRTLN